MSKICIEMEKLSNPNSGLGQYCYHLGKELMKIEDEELEKIFFVPSPGIFGAGLYVRQHPLHKFFMRGADQYDMWHCTHQQSKYLPSNKKTKLILTIHDLNFLEKYTSSVQIKNKLKAVQKLVNRASGIVFISHYTEKVTRENLIIPAIPTKVIYNGNNTDGTLQETRPTQVPPGDFIFTIGIINPKKNFKVLLCLLKAFPRLTLVIAGNKDHDYAKEILNEAISKGLQERLLMPGLISEEEKKWYYKNAKAFVFPSVSEGFGLPVIEAMSLGKPVFLSDLSSLPEVGGEEAYYWKSFDEPEMVKVFREGLNDFENDPQKKERIRSWSTRFSWENAAAEYWNFYKELI